MFPMRYIPKGAKVIIYGAGKIGKEYYTGAHDTGYCKVVQWVDRDVREAFGCHIISPDQANYGLADFVLVAIDDESVAKKVIDMLVGKSDVDAKKIIWRKYNADELYQDYIAYVRKHKYDNPKSALGIKLHSFDESSIRHLVAMLEDYDLVISENPEVEFYGFECGRTGLYPECKKNSIKVAFWPGESYVPDYTIVNYSIISRELPTKNNLYYSIFFPTDKTINDRKEFLSTKEAERKFCNFIYSNSNRGDGALLRKHFCNLLSEYKKVDCPGLVLNNMKEAIVPRIGNWVAGRREFVRNYKFTIAFENSSASGYSTEKLFETFRSGSIPIYWGNPDIDKYVDSRSFINCHDYHNFEEVVDRVIELDNNPDQYMEMLSTPPMNDAYRYNRKEEYQRFFEKILQDGI